MRSSQALAQSVFGNLATLDKLVGVLGTPYLIGAVEKVSDRTRPADAVRKLFVEAVNREPANGPNKPGFVRVCQRLLRFNQKICKQTLMVRL